MCEKCVALEARAQETYDWCVERDLKTIPEDETDLLLFILKREDRSVESIAPGVGMVTMRALAQVLGQAWAIGCKYGYERRNQELLLKDIKIKED